MSKFYYIQNRSGEALEKNSQDKYRVLDSPYDSPLYKIELFKTKAHLKAHIKYMDIKGAYRMGIIKIDVFNGDYLSYG